MKSLNKQKNIYSKNSKQLKSEINLIEKLLQNKTSIILSIVIVI